MITFDIPKHHWNYFLIIEKDLENISRYIEFSEANSKTYSIELTHILLSASSEIDVIMKEICSLIDPRETYENINEYRSLIKEKLSCFITEEIIINRFNLKFKPWENWINDKNPDWWRGYNKVKHERNNHFHEANLQNTMNAVGALLVATIYYYKLAFEKENNIHVSFKDTTHQLKPNSTFLEINADYYLFNIVG